MKKYLIIALLVECYLCSPVMLVHAATITNGFTYSVASDSDQSVGDHYHSSTGGAFGNPAGLAEVGSYATEEARGLSEYDLTGLSSSPRAYVTFNVYGYGLFSGANNFPFDGTIDIEAYQGNSFEEIEDYQTPSIGYVESFSTVGLTFEDVFSFDITGIFNAAINNSWNSLGIRLSTENTDNFGGAWVFNDFRLTNTDDTRISAPAPTAPVPEPSTLLLLGGGLTGLAWIGRKRRQA